MIRRWAQCCAHSALLIAACFPLQAAALGDFKFEQNPGEEQQKAEEDKRRGRIAVNLSTPCRQALKGKKIMVVIGEQHSSGYVIAEQQNYGAHFQVINARLRNLGLQTFTPEEIRGQIAQAELDAYFKNDPDGALSASRRLGAAFVLRGLITSHASQNPMMRVNQVSVRMGFSLASFSGKHIADAEASAMSYAGPDVREMARTLLDEQAGEVVSKLYSQYCRNADVAAPASPEE